MRDIVDLGPVARHSAASAAPIESAHPASGSAMAATPAASVVFVNSRRLEECVEIRMAFSSRYKGTGEMRETASPATFDRDMREVGSDPCFWRLSEVPRE
jgi:hypothetical protein